MCKILMPKEHNYDFDDVCKKNIRVLNLIWVHFENLLHGANLSSKSHLQLSRNQTKELTEEGASTSRKNRLDVKMWKERG